MHDTDESAIFRQLRNLGRHQDIEDLKVMLAAEGEDFKRGFDAGAIAAARVVHAILDSIEHGTA